jgi:hypothetical protein
MRCIVYHNDVAPPKILAMCTKCRKGLIAYHKFNGITTMKKHVDFDHFILLKKLLEEVVSIISRSPLNHEPNKKKAHLCPTAISIFFTINKSKKDDAT